METYRVKVLKGKNPIEVEVPGSKSITNRALLLAALGRGRCLLTGVLFSDDSRVFLRCLENLGFHISIDEEKKQVCIDGLGGQIPNRNARINVGSAGTAARFLTVMLAFAGGTYHLDSSEQMKKRPMEPLIEQLRQAGASITCLEEEGHFPFKIESRKLFINEITMDTSVSSQFASALLMCAPLLSDGLKLRLSGERKEGSYIRMTLAMMKQFGVAAEKEGTVWTIRGGQSYELGEYAVEPDMSAACYFFALALICNRKVLVKHTHEQSLQGDEKFLEVLRTLGCSVDDRPEGIEVTGVGEYEGICINMKDFSDQALTMAAVAVFAKTPTRIEEIGHIRMQESDRICAMTTELSRLGIQCRELDGGTGVEILPGNVKPAEIETYEDHRVAMAFTLVGLRVPGIVINNPMCCRKTFENYYDVMDDLMDKE